jgi:hypothetical protein
VSLAASSSGYAPVHRQFGEQYKKMAQKAYEMVSEKIAIKFYFGFLNNKGKPEIIGVRTV